MPHLCRTLSIKNLVSHIEWLESLFYGISESNMALVYL